MLDTDIRSDNSYTSGILFGQYLLKKLGNYRRPAAAGLNYQVEYILGGKNSDRRKSEVRGRKTSGDPSGG